MSKSDAEIEELKRHPSVIHLYTQKLKLERQGRRFRGLCPFHSEDTPSLDVYENQGVYLWKCLGCGKAGNILQLLQGTDGISFGAAVKVVQDFVKGSPEQDKKVVEEVFKSVGTDKKKRVLNLDDIKKWELALQKNQAAQDWLLKERGITYETAKRLHTGYCQDIGKLIGSQDQDLQNKGWIVFPVVQDNKVLAVKFRSIERKVFRKLTGMRSDVLYNADTIDVLDPVCLCEGEFDVMVMEQAGYKAVSLPNANTKVTPEMKDVLLGAETVILAGDNDGAAGTEAMRKLWAELGSRAIYVEWPAGRKDANEVFLKECKGDVSAFRTLVNGLVGSARSVVMPGVYSLQESMRAHRQTDLANHPERFRFGWPSVDKMAVLLPGDVAVVLATTTKGGKTTWMLDATLNAAIKHDEVVINYQAELELDRFASMVAANVLKKDRNHLTPEDVDEAAQRISHIRYYVGSNPSLNTVGPVLDLIEAAIRRLGATVVVLDHLHHICRNVSDEVKAQADAMQRICLMSRKYRVKFFVLAQPRKANQQSRGKRLTISDGKGSEAIYSDSAAVYALHRDLVKVTDPPPDDPYEPLVHVHLLAGARSKGDGGSEARLFLLGKYACYTEVSYDKGDSGALFG